jgi:Flp pilus assembly protein TadD
VDSIQQLKTALIENPGDKELWNYLGRKLMDNGEPLLAIIAYRNALKLDPAFIYPMVNLANAYLAIDLYDLAFGLATALQGMELDSWSAKESVRILQTDCE